MADSPTVLVLDEAGELARIEKLVTRLGVDCTRWRDDPEDSPPPRELLVTTGATALQMSTPEAWTSKGDDRIWLCVHGEDFFPLRDRLRERGVHYLVQMTTDDEALRLLLQQLLYRGADRRSANRLPMDCPVEVAIGGSKKRRAKLLELSSDGCRLQCGAAIDPDTPVSVRIPNSLGGVELELCGKVIRTETRRGGKDVIVMQIGELDAKVREQIEAILRGDRIGTRVTPLAAVPEREPDVYVDGTGIPDWDEIARQGDRRRYPRRPYPHPVETAAGREGGDSFSAMGVELSIEGMRIVGLPDIPVGSQVRVALHSNAGGDPLALEAEVMRDDGESVALRFCAVTPELRAQIESLMAESPSVEALQSGDLGRIVMSEVTSIDFSMDAV